MATAGKVAEVATGVPVNKAAPGAWAATVVVVRRLAVMAGTAAKAAAAELVPAVPAAVLMEY